MSCDLYTSGAWNKIHFWLTQKITLVLNGKKEKERLHLSHPLPTPCFQDGIVLLVIMLAFQEQALKFDWLFCFNAAFSLAGNLKSDRLFCLSVAFSLAGKKMRFTRFIREYIAQLSHQQFKMEKFDNYPSSKLHII